MYIICIHISLDLQSVFVDIMDVCSSDSDKNNLKKLSTKFGIKL